MKRALLSALVSSSISLSACSGHVVELEHSGSGGAAAGIDSIVLEHSSDPIVSRLSVDESRLYWSTFGGKVQSCDKTNCPNTLRTYASHAQLADHSNIVTRVSAAGGRVVWAGEDPDDTILSCPISGCEAAPSRIFRDSRGISGLLADADYVYWASSIDLYRCQASGCETTPELVAPGKVSSLQVSGNSAYWASYEPCVTDCSGPRIYTAPKDGSGTPRVLLPAVADAFAFTLNAQALFWQDRDGQLLSCPLADCNGKPTLVLDGDTSPKVDLFADETRLYWRNEANLVQTCAIANCIPQTISSAAAQSFAVDSESVYWTDVKAGREFLGLTLHRVAKSAL